MNAGASRQGTGAVPASKEWSSFQRLADPPVEAMHAHLYRHVYDRHIHETYSFGVTEQGTQAFRCRGAAHASHAGMLMTFNPDDPHDGHNGDPEGFTYPAGGPRAADGRRPGGGRAPRQPRLEPVIGRSSSTIAVAKPPRHGQVEVVSLQMVGRWKPRPRYPLAGAPMT